MINMFVLEGNLTRDPELRYTPSGTALLKFTLANNNGYGDYKKTLFMECVMFGKRGEAVEQYLSKGQRVIVYGKLNTNDWEDSNGNKRRSYSLAVDELSFGPGNKQQVAPIQETSEPTRNTSIYDDDIPF